MRDGWLGEVDAFLNVSSAEAGIWGGLPRSGFSFGGGPLAKGLQDAATGGVGDGVKGAVEGWVRGHAQLGIARKSMSVNVGVLD